MVVITGKYEVLRFIEHGSRCRPAMDCVQGELLIYRVRRCPEIQKEVLFTWLRQLIIQIEQYHRCRNDQSYRYINPYSVLITGEDQILLLDLEAESNAFVLKNMQKRAMRNHFVKPVVHIRENTKLSPDLCGYAKTIQFILAEMKADPDLTKWEEYRLSKVIQKCLNEKPGKQYEELRQIERELPAVKFKKQKSGQKKRIAQISFFLLMMLTGIAGYHHMTKAEKQQSLATTEEQAVEENLSGKEEPIEEMMAETEDEMTERALNAYRTLCSLEEEAEYLERAYIRRISLEREVYPGGKVAVDTGEEAMRLFPESVIVALEYAETVYACDELSDEEKEMTLKFLSERFSEVRESEGYVQWELGRQDRMVELQEKEIKTEKAP